MDYPYHQLEDRFKSIPDDVRDMMTSPETMEAVRQIGQKYHLHVDEMDELYEETGHVMLGLTRTKDFIGNLRKRLPKYDPPLVQSIALEINELVFKPIRESLKKLESTVRAEPLSAAPTSTQREELLRAIEDPSTLAPLPVKTPEIVPTPQEEELLHTETLARLENEVVVPAGMNNPHNMTESLSTPVVPLVSAPEDLSVVKLKEATESPVHSTVVSEIKKEPGADPYREAIS